MYFRNTPLMAKFKTALREILLIVIGILIALQIENWNEQYKSEKFKNDMLAEVMVSLNSDLAQIDDRLQRIDFIERSLSAVTVSLESGEPSEPKVAEQLSRLSWSVVFEPRTAAYESLKAGGLDSIEHNSTRLQLIHVYDYVYPRMDWFIEHEFNQFNEQYARPVVYQHLGLKKDDTSESANWQFLEWQALHNDPTVLTMVYRKLLKLEHVKVRLESSRQEVEKLLALIDEELR